MIAAVNLLAVYEYDALSHHPISGWISRYGVMTSTRVVARLPTVLSSSLVLRRSEFTVIAGSCICHDVSIMSPLMLRCQTSPSMWTLGGDKPVIPRVAFIR